MSQAGGVVGLIEVDFVAGDPYAVLVRQVPSVDGAFPVTVMGKVLPLFRAPSEQVT